MVVAPALIAASTQRQRKSISDARAVLGRPFDVRDKIARPRTLAVTISRTSLRLLLQLVFHMQRARSR